MTCPTAQVLSFPNRSSERLFVQMVGSLPEPTSESDAAETLAMVRRRAREICTSNSQGENR